PGLSISRPTRGRSGRGTAHIFRAWCVGSRPSGPTRGSSFSAPREALRSRRRRRGRRSRRLSRPWRERAADEPPHDGPGLVLLRDVFHEPVCAELAPLVLDRLRAEAGFARDAGVERVGFLLAFALEDVEDQTARVRRLRWATRCEEQLVDVLGRLAERH